MFNGGEIATVHMGFLESRENMGVGGKRIDRNMLGLGRGPISLFSLLMSGSR